MYSFRGFNIGNISLNFDRDTGFGRFRFLGFAIVGNRSGISDGFVGFELKLDIDWVFELFLDIKLL